MPFKLALAQMSVVGGDRARNVARAEEMIAEAAADKADIVVLPEAMDIGWTHTASRDLATPIPDGEVFQRLAKAAAKHKIFVCSGLTERAGQRVYNAAVLLDRNGKLLLLHRKLNELEIGHRFYDQGDRVGVAHTELGTIGLMICADGFTKDQAISRSLGYMGADIILSPSAWAVPADHDNVKQPYGETWRKAYLPVAQDFSVWMVGVSNVGPIDTGPWAGRRCIGCSYVVAPGGKEILQGPYGIDAEALLTVDIELTPRPARGTGWMMMWTGEEK
ncbi:MAG: carbon-nitrogen hydrolase family protein [Planctomycetota bacterium]|nr:carbon-nitrogen hydrolase family protein [Planctomycetota bacterium]